MQNKFDWEPNVEDWGNVNLEAYKFMFAQAKDSFEEQISNSEDITNKSQKLTIGLFTFLAAFISFSPNISINVLGLFVFCVLLLVSIFFLAILLFPKKVILRGSMPIEIFTDDLDSRNWTIEEQEKLIYYREIIRYQQRITDMKKYAKDRLLYFKIALGTSFVLLIFLTLLIFGNVSRL